MEERLDILNEKGEKTGESDTYNNVHLRGLVHRAVHVWLLNSKGQLLLQKRSKDQRAYPNLWDISAAGHISSGETSLQAAKKETREELGIDLLDSEFELIATLKQPTTRHSETFIDNEFNDIYLVHSDLDISEFKMQPEEVEELRWIDIEDFKKWMAGEGEKLVPHTEEHRKLLEYLSLNQHV